MKKIIITFIACIPIAMIKPMEDKVADLKKITSLQAQTKHTIPSSQARKPECFFCGHTDCSNLRRLKE